MRILADVHGYPPGLNAGAEHYLKAVLEAMVARGHDALVWIGFEDTLRPVGGKAAGEPKTLDEAYRWADVIVTHLDRTGDVVRRAKEASKARRPLVHLVHNEAQLGFHRVRLDQADLVVFNSNATRRATHDWQGLSMVLRPPIVAGDYRVETTREFVTLINLNENKGGQVFREIAHRMPDLKFLGVRGGYEKQLVPHGQKNATVWDNQDDIRRVYARTRILLVPSAYESYGRVAVEAAASGIPVLAHPTPGLVEAMGDAAIFLDRGNIGRWVRTIRDLTTNRLTYREWSRRAQMRAAELDPTDDLDRFEAALQLITGKAAA